MNAIHEISGRYNTIHNTYTVNDISNSSKTQ